MNIDGSDMLFHTPQMRIRSPEKDILTPDQSGNMKLGLSMSNYPSLKSFMVKLAYLVLILIYDPKLQEYQVT
jgi:hypothetical protein